VWFWLVGAVVAEVFATITLRFTEGFTRLVPSLLVVLGYGTAFFALSQALVRGVLQDQGARHVSDRSFRAPAGSG